MKPRIAVSKCLGFAACRWDGVKITDDFVDSLKGRVAFVTVCPEAAIRLGVPRDPIRIVSKSKSAGRMRLVQTTTGRDVSAAMRRFSRKFLASLEGIDGFILKDRSPSCGLRNVEVYRTLEASAPVGRTRGFFGAEVCKRFKALPIETETRLANKRIRKDFLERVFAGNR